MKLRGYVEDLYIQGLEKLMETLFICYTHMYTWHVRNLSIILFNPCIYRYLYVPQSFLPPKFSLRG